MGIEEIVEHIANFQFLFKSTNLTVTKENQWGFKLCEETK